MIGDKGTTCRAKWTGTMSKVDRAITVDRGDKRGGREENKSVRRR